MKIGANNVLWGCLGISSACGGREKELCSRWILQDELEFM